MTLLPLHPALVAPATSTEAQDAAQMVLVYENLICLDDMRFANPLRFPDCSRRTFLSFTDGLKYLIGRYGLSGRKLLLPAFYCDESVECYRKAGLVPVFCPVDQDTFDVDTEAFERLLIDEEPGVVFVYDFFGKRSILYSRRQWLEHVGEDVVIVSDCAHTLLAGREIEFLSERHFYMDSARKNTTSMISNMLAPPGHVFDEGLITDVTFYKIWIRALFGAKTFFLHLATLLDSRLLLRFADWLYGLHDKHIGTSKESLSGFRWDAFVFDHIDFNRIFEARKRLYPLYAERLRGLRENGHVTLLDVEEGQRADLNFFFARVNDAGRLEGLNRMFAENGIWAGKLWDFDRLEGVSDRDRDFARRIIIFPYTIDTTEGDVERTVGLLEGFFAGEAQRILACNPARWTVASIVENGFGRVLSMEGEGAVLNTANFYVTEGVEAKTLAELVRPPCVVISSDRALYAQLAGLFRSTSIRTRRLFSLRREDFTGRTLDDREFTIRPVDAVVARQVQQTAWADDVFDSYGTIEDFLRGGLGFCALHGERPVSVCVSFSESRFGVEIEIDTDPAYEGRGLAKAVASVFIEECFRRGRTPLWDAANPVSIGIARKLGFRQIEEYEVLDIGG